MLHVVNIAVACNARLAPLGFVVAATAPRNGKRIPISVLPRHSPEALVQACISGSATQVGDEDNIVDGEE